MIPWCTSFYRLRVGKLPGYTALLTKAIQLWTPQCGHWPHWKLVGVTFSGTEGTMTFAPATDLLTGGVRTCNFGSCLAFLLNWVSVPSRWLLSIWFACSSLKLRLAPFLHITFHLRTNWRCRGLNLEPSAQPSSNRQTHFDLQPSTGEVVIDLGSPEGHGLRFPLAPPAWPIASTDEQLEKPQVGGHCRSFKVEIHLVGWIHKAAHSKLAQMTPITCYTWGGCLPTSECWLSERQLLWQRQGPPRREFSSDKMSKERKVLLAQGIACIGLDTGLRVEGRGVVRKGDCLAFISKHWHIWTLGMQIINTKLKKKKKKSTGYTFECHTA